MLIYTAVSKLLIYPTALSYYCGRDLLWSALMNFLVSGLIVFAVSMLCSRTQCTLFELIKNSLGEVVARVIYGLFALFFMVSALMPLFEQKLYVHAIFYDTVPSLMVFLPFFAFSVYAASKNLKNVGRCADICLPIFIMSMVLIFAMSVEKIDFTNFLPVLKSPKKQIFGASLGSMFRFVEPAYLLMFMGNFKYRKGDAAKITLSYFGGALLVLMFLVAFYGINAEIAASRQFAISKIALYFPGIETVGRVDLIALYVLEVAMLFALVLNIQLAVQCLVKCTGYESPEILSLAVNGVLLGLLVGFDHYFQAIDIFYNKWMWIVFLIFTIIAPLSAWALKRRRQE